MTTGLSGSFAVNGTELNLCPTEGRWLERNTLGYDGFGHPIYPRVRSFEMTWQLLSPAEFDQIRDFYTIVSNTGTIAVDLPEWNAADYRFARYSGCILHEPTRGMYFNEYIQEARLLITNIVA
jgi:hypothetical protein